MFATFLFTAVFAAQDYSEPDTTHSEGMPWCSELEITGEPVDCALSLSNDTMLLLDYTADTAVDEWGEPLASLEVRHHQLDGSLIQTFNEVVDRTYAVPEATDINNDGIEEVLIPTYTGNVNSVWQVWQLVDGVFVDAGEVSGLGLAYDADIGLPVIASRGSASTWFRSAWFLDPEGLILVYELETDLGFETCSVVEGSAISESAQTAAEIIAACEADMAGGGE